MPRRKRPAAQTPADLEHAWEWEGVLYILTGRNGDALVEAMRPHFPSHLSRKVLFDRFRAERYRLEPLIAQLKQEIAMLAQEGEEQEKKRLPPLTLSPAAAHRLARQKESAAEDQRKAAEQLAGETAFRDGDVVTVDFDVGVLHVGIIQAIESDEHITVSFLLDGQVDKTCRKQELRLVVQAHPFLAQRPRPAQPSLESGDVDYAAWALREVEYELAEDAMLRDATRLQQSELAAAVPNTATLKEDEQFAPLVKNALVSPRDHLAFLWELGCGSARLSYRASERSGGVIGVVTNDIDPRRGALLEMDMRQIQVELLVNQCPPIHIHATLSCTALSHAGRRYLGPRGHVELYQEALRFTAAAGLGIVRIITKVRTLCPWVTFSFEFPDGAVQKEAWYDLLRGLERAHEVKYSHCTKYKMPYRKNGIIVTDLPDFQGPGLCTPAACCAYCDLFRQYTGHRTHPVTLQGRDCATAATYLWQFVDDLLDAVFRHHAAHLGFLF